MEPNAQVYGEWAADFLPLIRRQARRNTKQTVIENNRSLHLRLTIGNKLDVSWSKQVNMLH